MRSYSTTAKNLACLQHSSSWRRQEGTLIDFTFDGANDGTPNFEDKLNQLADSIKKKLILKKGPVTLTELEAEFKTLCELDGNNETFSCVANEEKASYNLSEQDKIIIEEYKLLIIKNTLSHLQKMYPLHSKTQKEAEEFKAQPSKSEWRFWLYVILSVSNVLFMAIGGFLGMQEMLVGIDSHIPKLISYAISGFFTLFECIMVYSVMAPYLRQGLHLPEETNKTITRVYGEQYQATQQINDVLSAQPQRYASINTTMYENHSRLAKTFNDYVANIKIEEPEETTLTKGIQWLFLAVNTLLNISNSYFMTTAFLQTMAVATGTPLGWSIILIVIAIQLTSSYIIRSESTYDMLNPHAPKIKETKEKIAGFEKRNDDFDLILENKRRTQSQTVYHPTRISQLRGSSSMLARRPTRSNKEHTRLFFASVNEGNDNIEQHSLELSSDQHSILNDNI